MSNRISWGLDASHPGIDRKVVHIVIASLQQGRGAIYERVDRCVAARLAFVDRTRSQEELLIFGKAMGCEPSACEDLVELDLA